MFSTRGLALVLTLVLLVTANAFVIAQPNCSNSCCKATNIQCFDGPNGIPNRCYQYTNSGAACTTCCGTGSLYGGYCKQGSGTGCDPGQVCLKTTATYQYQYSANTYWDGCAVASSYNEVVGIGGPGPQCGTLGQTKYNEALCTCGLNPSDPTKLCGG